MQKLPTKSVGKIRRSRKSLQNDLQQYPLIDISRYLSGDRCFARLIKINLTIFPKNNEANVTVWMRLDCQRLRAIAYLFPDP